ncbi:MULTISPECIES: cytochrome P460 family protein [Phenylobacterium]|uniref:Cytochrome P460 domain-containing protein n=1 Tax=Phenylobacterium koreense TaxID=266125 RepID=A0ABV2EF64_9CAUL
MKRTPILGLGVVAVALGSTLAVAASPKPASVADPKGALRVPADYQRTYEYLGSWAVAADKGLGSKEMHVVYASPGATAAFKRTGHFPDGAVLVKEVRGTSTQSMTTGTVSNATALKGWFVSVRDSKNSHPGDPLWGDGWGWSWFDADKPTQTTSTDYRKDCLGCHQPAESTDWMYSSGYPALQR